MWRACSGQIREPRERDRERSEGEMNTHPTTTTTTTSTHTTIFAQAKPLLQPKARSTTLYVSQTRTHTYTHGHIHFSTKISRASREMGVGKEPAIRLPLSPFLSLYTPNQFATIRRLRFKEAQPP